MKDMSGGLNTIVEVPSEQSDSLRNHSARDEDDMHSDSQRLGSDLSSFLFDNQVKRTTLHDEIIPTKQNQEFGEFLF